MNVINMPAVSVYPIVGTPGPDQPVIMSPLPAAPTAQKEPYHMAHPDAHVVSTDGGNTWAVKMEHMQAYSGYWQTKTEAMAQAMYLAREAGTSMVVHGRNGRIQEVRNYG